MAKIELEPIRVIVESFASAAIELVTARREPGRPRLEIDAINRERYELGCQRLRNNPHMTVAQVAEGVYISRAQWYVWKRRYSNLQDN